MGARPWPHPGPGAQYPSFIDEEAEVQRVRKACPQSHGAASQVNNQAKSQADYHRRGEGESGLSRLLVRRGPRDLGKSCPPQASASSSIKRPMLDGPSSTEHACLLLAQFLSVTEPQEGQVPRGFTVWGAGEPWPRGRVEPGRKSSLRSSARLSVQWQDLGCGGLVVAKDSSARLPELGL